MSDDQHSDSPQATVVFERPFAAVELVVVLAGLLPIMGLALSSVTGVFRPGDLPALLPNWPFGRTALYGTAAAFHLFAISWAPATFAWVRRRTGRCEVDAEFLRFTPTWSASAIEVRFARRPEWRRTPHGLLVTIPNRSALDRLLRPLLIPATAEEDVDRALALLQAAAAPRP